MSKRPNKKTILLVVWLALLVGLIVAIPLLGKMGNQNSGPDANGNHVAPPAQKMDMAKLTAQWPLILAHAAAPARGESKTPYSLVEFGDFECPQCAKVRPLLEQLLAQYPHQANLIFVHRPFPFHKWAIPAAQASEIAASYGKFWPMYDLLYSQQDDLESYYYSDYASEVGIKRAEFDKAFLAHQGLAKVNADAAFGDALGVEQTPTLLVHDNKKGTITAYVGLQGTKNKDGTQQYPGVQQFVAQPPWQMIK